MPSTDTHRFARPISAICGLLLAYALAACGVTSEPGPAKTAAHLDGTSAKDYSSLATIGSDSTDIVVVKDLGSSLAGPADEAGTSKVSALVSSASVIQVVKGDLTPGTKIAIRQIAAPGTAKAFDFNLNDDGVYLLFLQPFSFGAQSAPTGQFVVTGAAGAYSVTGDGSTLVPTTALSLVPGVAGSLPKTTTLSGLAVR